MHHDHYYLTNETMQMLFDALRSRDYNIWIDLKTQSEDSIVALIQRLKQNNMLYRSMVEIHDEAFHRFIPEGVQYGMYPHVTNGSGNVIIKQAKFLSEDFIKTSKLPIYTYHASSVHGMMETLRKGDVLLSYKYKPYYPQNYEYLLLLLIPFVLPLVIILMCRFLRTNK